MNKAEPKHYEEAKFDIIKHLIISSLCTFEFFTRVLFFLFFKSSNDAFLYRNKARFFFRVRSFCVAKSSANRNSHGLLKYLAL